MVKMLREAVLIEQASQKGTKNLKIQNIGLVDLWFMISTEKQALKQCYIHYKFSRQFQAEMEGLNRVLHQRSLVPKAIISKVISKLEITNYTNQKYILKLTQRASIQTKLANIFKGDLDYLSVVLYTVLDATYHLKTMTLTNCKVFFKTIGLTLKVLGNRILARLKAIDALY